jgi:mRNA interferase HigB
MCNTLSVRVITNRRLVEFARIHPHAAASLQAWRKTMEAKDYRNFAELKASFRSVDVAGDLHVFNIGGNKYRLIAFLHWSARICYIKHVLTHREYDKWKP